MKTECKEYDAGGDDEVSWAKGRAVKCRYYAGAKNDYLYMKNQTELN